MNFDPKRNNMAVEYRFLKFYGECCIPTEAYIFADEWEERADSFACVCV